MVEPTIGLLGGEIRQKQAEECKTRRTYGRTNHLPALKESRGRNRQKSVKRDGPMVEPTIWPAWEGKKAETWERSVRPIQTYW
ncbi:hypothetical protein DPMN_005250 [Dreissena polymorpha]|uniref:Uncharacterized protein n=1 Tax=Dreissena polymorpha TaxID=45954 RepID=A0A9D4RWB4_DREPO|nr:hypothetical protein DPMN_005250 [Dreissena polymorpha]